MHSEEKYIGKSDKTFAERYKEHMKDPSPIYDHHNTAGHISIDNFSTMSREDQNLARSIKEAIFFKANDLSLNRNIDRYQLPHVWDEVLVNSPELLSSNNKPINIQASGDTTSVTYMLVLDIMNHNSSP